MISYSASNLNNGKEQIDNGEAFGALLTDLSKTLDCHDHELVLVKCNAYGFSLPALKWVYDFTAQKMKFSIKDFFSKCDQIHSSE